MKITRLSLALVLLVGLAACEQKPKSTAEKIKDNVDDALDHRPNEKLRDAAEDLQKGAEDAAKDLKAAEEDAAKGLKKAEKKLAK